MTSPRCSVRTAQDEAPQVAGSFRTSQGSCCRPGKAARAGAPSCDNDRDTSREARCCPPGPRNRSRIVRPVAHEARAQDLAKSRSFDPFALSRTTTSTLGKKESIDTSLSTCARLPRALQEKASGIVFYSAQAVACASRAVGGSRKVGTHGSEPTASRTLRPSTRVLPSTSLRLLTRDAATLPGRSTVAGSSFSTTVTGHEHA